MAAAVAFSAGGAAAQERPRDQDPPADVAMQQRVQAIARERRPEMEAAARAFILNLALPGARSPGNEPLFIVDGVVQGGEGPPTIPALDRLKATNLDGYWMEIGQLAVQFDMFQQVVARDTVRARTLAAMFGTEFQARAIQRAWRGASEADHQRMRSQLETLMTTHFEMEDRLRALEMQDIERRLADVRAETERRRQRRAEMVRWSVDDIIHGAERPEF